MDRFVTADGRVMNRVGYVEYLRRCADSWANSTVGPHSDPRETAHIKRKHIEQAERIRAKADRLERGGDE